MREAHKLVAEEANKREREAEETTAYLKQNCLLGRKWVDLARRKEELARSQIGRRLAAPISPIKDPVEYIPTPTRPATAPRTSVTRRTAPVMASARAGGSGARELTFRKSGAGLQNRVSSVKSGRKTRSTQEN